MLGDHPVCMLVPAPPAQLPGSGRNDGRARTQPGPYDHPAQGQAISPELVRRWNRVGRTAVRSSRVDETYIEVRGRWSCRYRAVDEAGQTIDFRLSRVRDVARAKVFFRNDFRHEWRSPHTITLGGYAASDRAVSVMRMDGLLPKRTVVRSSKYLNNLIEQDHRGVRSRTRPMPSFKNFESAANTIARVELLRRIHKDQFALNRLRLKGQAAPAIWNAVPAA